MALEIISTCAAAAFVVGSGSYVCTRPNLGFGDKLAVLGWSLVAVVPVGALGVGFFMVLGALSFWGWGGSEATVLMFVAAPCGDRRLLEGPKPPTIPTNRQQMLTRG